MKALILASMVLSSAFAQADTLVCAIKDAKNPKNYSSIKVDLAKIEESGYNDDKGILVGDNDFSFGLIVLKEKGEVSVNAVFYENRHVQDEVASYTWDVKLSEVKKGKPVIEEPLEMDDVKVANFVCYINKPAKKKK